MAPRLPPQRFLTELTRLYEESAHSNKGSVFLTAKQAPEGGCLVRAQWGSGRKKRKLTAVVQGKDFPGFLAELSTLQRASMHALRRRQRAKSRR